MVPFSDFFKIFLWEKVTLKSHISLWFNCVWNLQTLSEIFLNLFSNHQTETNLNPVWKLKTFTYVTAVITSADALLLHKHQLCLICEKKQLYQCDFYVSLSGLESKCASHLAWCMKVEEWVCVLRIYLMWCRFTTHPLKGTTHWISLVIKFHKSSFRDKQ